MSTQRNPKKAVSAAQLHQLDQGSLLDELMSTFKAKKDDDRTQVGRMLTAFLREVVAPGALADKGVLRAIHERIAAIDQKLSAQLNEILHHPDLQKLEGTWRGLSSLVKSSETSTTLQLRVLNATKKDLLRDFQAANEFTESALWKGIYQAEYGTFGGDPYGVLLGDYEFGKDHEDVELMSHMATVAAGSHAPFIGGTAPEMFGLDSFTQMPEPRDLAKIFDKANPKNTKWLSFRDSEDSRYVGLVLPRVLGRMPYGSTGRKVDCFAFEEDTDGSDHERYLWSSAVYAYGARMTDAFAKYHWCTAIRGPEGGGLVKDLPIHVFQSREGDIASKCPTEVLISEDRTNELGGLGFIGLCNRKNSDQAAFFSGNSVQRPKQYDTHEATANADLSSKLPYLMATSRIAHYLKSIARDKIGSFMTASDCQTFLERWIKRYVLDQDGATQDQKAKFPLREASIIVEPDKSRPGCYRAKAFLKPHFQLENLKAALHLVADLPKSVKP